MARTGIRFEDVQDAAETLLGRGLNPTIQRVREVLGTGSNSTISEHLRTWQQQLAEAPKVVLPPTVPEAVMTALDAFWKIAVQNAEAAFEAQRIAGAQAIKTAEQACDAAIAGQRQAQAIADNLRREIESTKITARELADHLLVEQERRAAAETAIQSAEQRARAAAETVTQIRTETQARVEQLENALQQARLDREQQETEARRLMEAERQRAETTEVRLNQILEHNRAEWTTEREAFASERLDWKHREVAWQARLENQERENALARETIAVANERQHNQQIEFQKIKLSLKESGARYLETLRTAENLRGELKAALEARHYLEQQVNQTRPTRSSRKNVPKPKEP